MRLKDSSWEQRLENLLPELPRWPLTAFGTAVLIMGLIIFLACAAFGWYQWNNCLEIRGLL